MARMIYRDLAEFGLPFVTPGQEGYEAMAAGIERPPSPFGLPEETAAPAVLRNDSGKAVIALGVIWRYVGADGRERTNRRTNLGGPAQLDVLRGQARVTRDLTSFFLPGSKRLISEHGLFGTNRDVLGAQEAPSGHGFVSAAGAAVGSAPGGDDSAEVELRLDVAIFEDGLCVGQDDLGLMEGLLHDLELQRRTAQEIEAGLRAGWSIGEAFERLRVVARPGYAMGRAMPAGVAHTHLASSFAQMAIHRLIHFDGEDLAAWYHQQGAVEPLRLRRETS